MATEAQNPGKAVICEGPAGQASGKSGARRQIGCGGDAQKKMEKIPVNAASRPAAGFY